MLMISSDVNNTIIIYNGLFEAVGNESIDDGFEGKIIAVMIVGIMLIFMSMIIYFEARCLKDHDCKPSGPCWWWYGDDKNGRWEKDEDCGL